MTKIFFSFMLLLLAIPTLAQKGAVAPGSKVYVAPMDGNLNGFISAEILKQKLPILVVTDEAVADYTLSGQAQVSGRTGKGAGGSAQSRPARMTSTAAR